MFEHTNMRWIRRQVSKLVRGLTLYRYWEHLVHFSIVNVIDALPAFAANSSGTYRNKARLALRSANETVPLLARLCQRQASGIEPIDIDSRLSSPSTDQLSEMLQKHGSDKSRFHNYHMVYGNLFEDRTKVKKVFEIGLGTNNPEVVSSMGFHGTPGASLRAFRDFFPNAHIFGADIDTRVLFQEDRINTFYIDQLTDASFEELPAEASGDLDLFIDDGLHSPDANLRSLVFGLKAVRPGGFVVIEDIREEAIDIWRVASALLPEDCHASLYRGSGAWMFVVKKGAA